MKLAKTAVAVTTAVLCALALGPAAIAATTHAWAQDGFDAGNTGFNPNETVITRSTLPTTVAWRWGILSPVVPEHCGDQFAPVVAGGRLFLADEGGFAAYNAATGAPLWSVRFVPAADSEITALAVSGDTLLVSAETSCHSVSDPDGTLTAYNVAGGAVLWSAFRDAPISHLVTDQGVVLGTGNDAADDLATAYRVSDGHVLWNAEIAADNAVSAAGRVLLTVSGGTEAVDITTGAVAWTKPTQWLALAATPDNKRYIVRTFSGDLVEIFAVAGGVAWTKPGEAGPVQGDNSQVAVDASQVYVVHDNHLDAFATTTGTPAWSVSVAGTAKRPVVAGGIVYTIEPLGLDTFNSTTGAEILFESGFFQGYIDHAVVENGRLYLTTGRVLDTYTP